MEPYRFGTNAVLRDHTHHGSELIFVLEGERYQYGQRLPSGRCGIVERGTKDEKYRSGENCALTITVYGNDVEFF